MSTSVKTVPGNGVTLTTGTAVLGWNGIGAPGYEVCVDTTNDNACNATWQATGTATTLTLTALATGTYYWMVPADDARGQRGVAAGGAGGGTEVVQGTGAGPRSGAGLR